MCLQLHLADIQLPCFYRQHAVVDSLLLLFLYLLYNYLPPDIYKTAYYNFGAGVPTELTGNETLSYGNDGSIIIDHIDKKIDNLTYYLSSIYDHILRINDGEKISLWEVCGKNKIITIKIRS